MQSSSEIKESLGLRKTRVSGCYAPGFYCKIKIIPEILPLNKKNLRKINYTPGLAHFKNDLQCFILKNLKAKGGCLRSGVFIISKEVANFLKKKYNITKRWQNNKAILDELGIIVKIFKPNFAVHVSDFNLKLGNRRTQKVQVEVSFYSY